MKTKKASERTRTLHSRTMICPGMKGWMALSCFLFASCSLYFLVVLAASVCASGKRVIVVFVWRGRD